jgi:hypothetical protein
MSVGDIWRDTFLKISGFGADAQAALTGQSWNTYQANKSNLANMSTDTLNWKLAVEEYVGNVNLAFKTW